MRFLWCTQACDNFPCLFRQNEVLQISRFECRVTDQRFQTTKSVYELCLSDVSTVHACPQDAPFVPLPPITYINLKQYSEMPSGTVMNVRGLLFNHSGEREFKRRSEGKSCRDREVHLIDDTDTSIVLTLWESQGERLQSEGKPVISIQRGRTTSYSGIRGITLRLISEIK